MPRRSSRTSCVDADTIVAVSSPPGAGLRAVVRLSGPRAAEIGGNVAGAVVLRGPRTSTREDVVEIHLPGAPPLVEGLVRDLVSRGARPARPGEFTLRAFLSGRIDLAQAEAVEQLVSSEDEQERRAALAQVGGAFSARLGAIEHALLDLCADAEASIDFVDQDIEILPVEQAVARAEAERRRLSELLSESTRRAVTDHRPTVALYGRPNAGKSSLFNALTGADAVVTPVAGTTRDVLAAELDVGVRATLLDTAGDPRGAPVDSLESEAARRAREAVDSADLVLFVVDATDWEAALPLEPHGRPALLVVQKCDLASGDAVRSRFHMREAICASARTGQGLPELRTALRAMLGEAPSGSAARFRLNFRQHALLLEAEAALGRASATAPALGMEFVSLDLRAALDALGGLSGRQVSEDLLDRIFSRFCLGK